MSELGYRKSGGVLGGRKGKGLCIWGKTGNLQAHYESKLFKTPASQNQLIMAIIESTAIGKASGSAGAFTYRTVRGRVIVSARITTNRSKTKKQLRHRAAFSEMQRLGKVFRKVIDAGFEPTRYGSCRNHFHRKNTGYMQYMKQRSEPDALSAQEAARGEGPMTALHNLWLALRAGDFGGEVFATVGEGNTMSCFRADAEGSPVVKVAHDGVLQAGDVLHVVLGVTYMWMGSRHYRVLTIQQKLAEGVNTGEIRLDKEHCRRLDFRKELPKGIEEVCVVGAVYVGYAGGERSTSRFTAMEEEREALPEEGGLRDVRLKGLNVLKGLKVLKEGGGLMDEDEDEDVIFTTACGSGEHDRGQIT